MTTAVSGKFGAPGFRRLLNPLIQRLVGAGMPFGPNVLLTVQGRSTGQPRTFPVALLRFDGGRFVQSPFGEVNWVRNLRADGRAVLRNGHRREDVDAIELTPEEAGPVLEGSVGRYLRNPFLALILGRFFRFDRNSRAEDYVAEARRHPMFELRRAEG